MELKEFIKEVLSDIANAVLESQGELITTGVIINPNRISNSSNVCINDLYYEVHNIEFEIALSEEIGKEGKKGVGVFLSNVGVGASERKDSKNASNTNVKFKIPIVLPNSGKNESNHRKTAIKSHTTIL